MKAKWKHDCSKCRYLGSMFMVFDIVDWYVCGEGITGSVISRHGDDGPEYWSMPKSMVTDDNYLMAHRDSDGAEGFSHMQVLAQFMLEREKDLKLVSPAPPKVDCIVYNTGTDYVDGNIYVSHHEHPGEYRFHVFLNRKTKEFTAGEVCYSKNTYDPFDDLPQDHEVPLPVRELQFNSLPEMFRLLQEADNGYSMGDLDEHDPN